MQLIAAETRKALFDSFYRSSTTHWVIKCDGKYVVLNSGKSSWKTKGHARSALVVHCKTSNNVLSEIEKLFNITGENWYIRRRQSLDRVSEFIDIITNQKLIEFVEINNAP